MKELKDKYGFTVKIDESYISKLADKMPPVSIDIVKDVLLNATVVKASEGSSNSRCYYKKCSEDKWYKVVVKFVEEKNEHWISTGHMTDGIREREDFDENSL